MLVGMKAPLFLLTLLLALPAYSQELRLEPIPPGDSKIEVLHEGDPAPYGGQLFNDATALRWANWLKQAKLVYRIDMQAQQKQNDADIKLYELKLQLRQEQYNRVVAEYSEKLRKTEEESRNPSWYRTVWFGAVVGGAAVTVVGIGSIWAVSQLK